MQAVQGLLGRIESMVRSCVGRVANTNELPKGGAVLELNREVAQQGIFQVPPATVLVGKFAGWDINDVILYATLLYILVQLVVIYPKLRAAVRDIRNKSWRNDDKG